MIQFVLNHQAVVTGLVVAVLDLVFALNPNVNAPDGILHSIYVFIKKLNAPKTPQ